MKQKRKQRFDELLLERGIAGDIGRAQALILSGDVAVSGVNGAKAGSMLREDVLLVMKEKNPFVSRGGLKLKAALDAFAIDVRGMICMDIGASTGGFTDCLIQSGALKVYAVDVGTGLLDSRLRSDQRVEVLEGINFRNFTKKCLIGHIEFVTIDVSFISLELILVPAVRCLSANGQIVALVKPQFESLPSETVKGVVKDETVRSRTIEKIKTCAGNCGLKLRGEIDSPLKGPKGNVEHFLWLHNE